VQSAGIAFLDQRFFSAADIHTLHVRALLSPRGARAAYRGAAASAQRLRLANRPMRSGSVETIMSAIKNESRVDDPLSDLPPLLPQSPPVALGPSTLTTAPPVVPEIANAPPMAPGIGGPNLDLPSPRLRPFEGDVATADVPGRWRLGRRFVRRRPIRTTGQNAAGRWIDGLAFAVILSAIVALSVTTLLTFLDQERKQAVDVVGMVTPLLEGTSRMGKPAPPVRLVIKSQKGFMNEPLPLGVSLNHASGGETVTLAGLAPGTILSVGTPLGLSGWQVPARDIGKAAAYPPKDFVGVMDAAIDVHSASDWLMDSRVIRLEWIPKEATSRLDSR
jgi:hypothetical protein